ncbi:acyl-CoA dehydrogenase family protein [Bradyrhizobium sp. USDA 4469]
MNEPELSEQERLIQKTARDMAETHFRPRAAAADRDLRPPMDNLKVLAEHGFTGTFIPESYGGPGLTLFESVLMIEQIARSCANTAILLSVTDGATQRAILHIGSEEQKQRYLPRFADGSLWGAWSMSEAEAGSDVGNVRTRAIRDGDHFRISGAKLWCSCAQVAHLFLVLVRFNDDPGMKGVGALLVDRDTKGFTIGEHLDLIGLRATGMAPLFFDDCRIPASNLLIPPGGMGKLLKVLDVDRVAGNPTICLGAAAAALEDITAFLKERRQFGQSLSEFQGIQWKLADMAIDIEAARALVYRAAKRLDAGVATIADASIAKTFANEMAIRVTNTAMQLGGASGLSAEYPFERYYRDVRGMAIGYGTTEVHRNVIGREILLGRYLP